MPGAMVGAAASEARPHGVNRRGVRPPIGTLTLWRYWLGSGEHVAPLHNRIGVSNSHSVAGLIRGLDDARKKRPLGLERCGSNRALPDCPCKLR